MKKSIITDAISVLFIFLFTYASTSKLIGFPKFKVQLGQSPLLTSFSGLVAWTIPIIEILIALALTTRAFRSLGLYASLLLMSLFTAYIIAITRFSEYIPCSCGGVLQHMNWNQHLIFNITFVLLAITAIFLQASQQSLQIQTSKSYPGNTKD